LVQLGPLEAQPGPHFLKGSRKLDMLRRAPQVDQVPALARAEVAPHARLRPVQVHTEALALFAVHGSDAPLVALALACRQQVLGYGLGPRDQHPLELDDVGHQCTPS
jgi:hypothetical protein